MSNLPSTAVLHVPAMDCPEEFSLIEKGLARVAGVSELHANYVDRTVYVKFVAGQLSPERLAAEITLIGFSATCRGAAEQQSVRDSLDRTRQARRWATAAGGALLLAAFAAWFVPGSVGAVGSQALAVASTIASSVFVAQAAWRAVRLRALDMHVLMCLATVGGVATGNALEAATAMFLFGVSLFLEGYSLGRARKAVQSVLELSPPTAHRLTAAGAEDVAPDRLVPGDVVRVRPGERIPVDGVVVSGNSAVNQAPITGESLPIDKAPGDAVFAGALCVAGSLDVRATTSAAENTLTRIARLVEQAHATRSPTQRFVDEFARRYTPAIIALAIGLALGPPLIARGGVEWAAAAPASEWLHRALVMLVIACPCALVLSTPVTIVCGLFQAARRGIVIKGGEHLEAAGRITHVAFDKTGTLTTGDFCVTDVTPLAHLAPNEALAVAAAMEQHSVHPLAQAIVAEARRRGLQLPAAVEFQSRPGIGVFGVVDGQRCAVGGAALLRQLGVSPPTTEPRSANQVQQAAPEQHSGQFLVVGQTPAARFQLTDAPRPEAAKALAALRQLGVRRLTMLTGDQPAVAEHLMDQLKIDDYQAGLLPEEKVTQVQALSRAGDLAMVGDGVNDAPALAAARLGIALGSQASGTALETADVVVMTPDLRRVPELLALGRRCRQLLRQNIVLALGIKLAVLLLAAGGWASMWLAVGADVGASLLVIFNGMRILEPAGEGATKR